MEKTWKDNLDPVLKGHLEVLIKESCQSKKAYSEATNPINAQLWVALANLSKQIFNMELKLNYLERTLQDLTTSKIESKKIKKEADIKKKKTIRTIKKF